MTTSRTDEIDVDYECGECGRWFSVRQSRIEVDHAMLLVHCPICASPDNVVTR